MASFLGAFSIQFQRFEWKPSRLCFRQILKTSLGTGDDASARFGGGRFDSLESEFFREIFFMRAMVEDSAGNPETAALMMQDLAVNHKSKRAAMYLANAVGDTAQFAAWTDDQRREYYRWLDGCGGKRPVRPNASQAAG